MAIPARTNDNISRGQAVIAVRARDVAHMEWIAAEIESERALRAWFDTGASQDADTYRAYLAAVDREEVAARDLQRLSALTQLWQEQLAQSE